MSATDLEARTPFDDPAYWVGKLEEALLDGSDELAEKARGELRRLGWKAERIAEESNGETADHQ